MILARVGRFLQQFFGRQQKTKGFTSGVADSRSRLFLAVATPFCTTDICITTLARKENFEEKGCFGNKHKKFRRTVCHSNLFEVLF